MIARNDRTFNAAVVVAALIHVAALAVVSVRTVSAPGRGPVEMVPVQFERAEAAPIPTAIPPAPRPAAAPTVKIPTPLAPRPVRTAVVPGNAAPGRVQNPPRSAPAGLPGRGKTGGGGISTGTASAAGTFAMGGGTTPIGWVPGRGSGKGSGDGPGTGNRAPVGVGTTPGPVAPPPPAPKREVTLRVCSVSGDVPGKWCEKTVSRTFDEGREPRNTCAACKAPVKPVPPPAYVSTHAEVVKEKLLSGPRPGIPSSVRQSTLDASVTCQWTVDKDGSVSGTEITSSSGIRALDDAVLDAVRRWRYSPATQNGVPRSVRKTTTFVFKR